MVPAAAALSRMRRATATGFRLQASGSQMVLALRTELALLRVGERHVDDVERARQRLLVDQVVTRTVRYPLRQSLAGVVVEVATLVANRLLHSHEPRRAVGADLVVHVHGDDLSADLASRAVLPGEHILLLTVDHCGLGDGRQIVIDLLSV